MASLRWGTRGEKQRPNIEMEPTLLTVRAIMSQRSAAHFARLDGPEERRPAVVVREPTEAKRTWLTACRAGVVAQTESA